MREAIVLIPVYTVSAHLSNSTLVVVRRISWVLQAARVTLSVEELEVGHGGGPSAGTAIEREIRCEAP